MRFNFKQFSAATHAVEQQCKLFPFLGPGNPQKAVEWSLTHKDDTWAKAHLAAIDLQGAIENIIDEIRPGMWQKTYKYRVFVRSWYPVLTLAYWIRDLLGRYILYLSTKENT